MAHVSLRVSEQEKKWMDGYAKANGINISDAIKQAFFEKLENEYDLKIIDEYENDKKNGKINYHNFDDVTKELGLDNEL